MLSRLIALKKQREKRLRLQISEGNKRNEELLINEKTLEQSLVESRKSWQELSESSTGIMTPAEYDVVSHKLKSFFEQDKNIQAEIKTLIDEKKHWEKEKLALQNEINRCCAQQEKLKVVIEDSNYDH